MNDGLALDKQQHMNPVFGLGDPAGEDLLGAPRGPGCRAPRVDPAQIGGLRRRHRGHPGPRRCSARTGEFFASGRLDNLSSGTPCRAHGADRRTPARTPAMRGPGAPIAVLAAFDHEEIGSASRSGAGGPVLEDVLVRISDGAGRLGEPAAAGLRGVVLRLRRRRPRRAPELRRAARPGQPAGAQRRAAAEDQRQPALRHRRRRGRPLGAAVRRRRDPVPGVRLQQRDALRLHDRPADRHPAGHPDRRRRRARCCPCTRPASSAASRTRTGWPAGHGRSSARRREPGRPTRRQA